MNRETILEYLATTSPHAIYSSIFKNKFLPYMIDNVPDEAKLLKQKEILVWYVDELKTHPTCQVHGCNNLTRLNPGKLHYNRACSTKCSGYLTAQERTPEEHKQISKKAGLTNRLKSDEEKQKICNKKRQTFFSNDQSKAIEQRKLTNLERYGVENPMMNKEIFERSQKNKITSNEDMIKAQRKTCMERYGQPHFNNPAKISETNKIVWASGTKLRIDQQNSYSYKEAHEKYKKTVMERYGVENVSQVPEIQEKKLKTSYRSKDYIMPSGKIIKVQGYEPKLLDELLLEYSEDEILTSAVDMPSIQYIGEDNNIHTYFPDVFIPTTNTIYEVKSEYTLEADKEMNKRKFKAVQEYGFNFELKVY